MNVTISKRLIEPLFLQWMTFSIGLQNDAMFQAILSELTVFAWELYYGRQSSYGVGPRTDGCFGGSPDEIAEYCAESIRQFGGEDVTASASGVENSIYVWTHFKNSGCAGRRHVHLIVVPDHEPPISVRVANT
jgi:hypothetical protein